MARYSLQSAIDTALVAIESTAVGEWDDSIDQRLLLNPEAVTGIESVAETLGVTPFPFLYAWDKDGKMAVSSPYISANVDGKSVLHWGGQQVVLTGKRGYQLVMDKLLVAVPSAVSAQYDEAAMKIPLKIQIPQGGKAEDVLEELAGCETWDQVGKLLWSPKYAVKLSELSPGVYVATKAVYVDSKYPGYELFVPSLGRNVKANTLITRFINDLDGLGKINESSPLTIELTGFDEKDGKKYPRLSLKHGSQSPLAALIARNTEAAKGVNKAHPSYQPSTPAPMPAAAPSAKMGAPDSVEDFDSIPF